ncbi:DUF1559 domain-containing protein [Paludisphaera mucosa]|uniref:DUF1559 domain-containing protein n=1 Tax=Paludisphaera mucosa TaxID=3030827 RepID=A0ABT6F9G0_9BACT|nr:DUF1559 domain-containing protein [Paludisphaera mucosa]MDG3004015.1 DUF1559 domain-containing protein [Paludisphaera mucosa]
MKRTSGFSLIELIIVLGVIAVILALMLPVLRGGTEAARRIQCMNNLKQIHLGLHGYHATHEVYPPGVVDGSRPFSETGAVMRTPWTAMLLPFCEQRAVYDTLNFDAGAADAANSTARRTTINMMACPDSLPYGGWVGSSRSVLAGSAGQVTSPEFGRTSYAGCHHEIEKAVDVDDHGVFFLNSRVRAAEVFDGLSQTIFVGEVVAPAATGWLVGGRGSLRNTGAAINGLDAAALGDAAKSEAWRSSGRTPADLEALIVDQRITPPPGYVGGFGSNHRGDGAVFVFGDGSVRFLRASIDPTVFRRLGHRDDGEEIDDGSF